MAIEEKIEKLREIRRSLDGVTKILESMVKKQKVVATVNTALMTQNKIDDTIMFLSIDGVQFFAQMNVYEAYNRVRMARAWTGKVLQSLGSQYPYKADKDIKTNQDVKPLADEVPHSVLEEMLKEYSEMSAIEKIATLRDSLAGIASRIGYYNRGGIHEYIKEDFETLVVSENYLKEARFFLGYELGRLKNISENGN